MRLAHAEKRLKLISQAGDAFKVRDRVIKKLWLYFYTMALLVWTEIRYFMYFVELWMQLECTRQWSSSVARCRCNVSFMGSYLANVPLVRICWALGAYVSELKNSFL